MQFFLGSREKNAIAVPQPVLPHLPPEVVDLRFVGRRVPRPRHQFQPDRVLLQSFKAEKPLQRHRKVSPALPILCGKATPDKDGHAEMALIPPSEAIERLMIAG